MLGKRVLVAIILLPIGLAAIIAGGWYLTALVGVFMALAAWEYVTLFHAGGLQPAGVLVIGGTLLLVLSRNINGFNSAPWMISLLFLLSMTHHLAAALRCKEGHFRYQRGVFSRQSRAYPAFTLKNRSYGPQRAGMGC